MCSWSLRSSPIYLFPPLLFYPQNNILYIFGFSINVILPERLILALEPNRSVYLRINDCQCSKRVKNPKYTKCHNRIVRVCCLQIYVVCTHLKTHGSYHTSKHFIAFVEASSKKMQIVCNRMELKMNISLIGLK